MLSKLVQTFVGSRNKRALKKLQPLVLQINAKEKSMVLLSDEDIKRTYQDLKDRYQAGSSLNDLLVECFACVREAAKRTLGMRHFDVQLIGGMILHEGRIAEMSTGEGKTLMATLAVALNALAGQSVHLVTVNPYLAQRDADWMKPLYTALGLSVGVVVPGCGLALKKQAYACDIIYATNNELGFDYLRDKMAYSPEECVQGPLSYAIIDEVDSILIDEARTPLIISGAAEKSSDMYLAINKLVTSLKPSSEDDEQDFYIDEKSKQAYLTEIGHQHAEQLFEQAGLIQSGESLYHPAHIILIHHLNAALRAHHLFKRDVAYLIVDGKIVIVDEHTGRSMPGRRWSDGLHQALEAKEGVEIQSENQTLASITFQNFFRLYDKLSGMTGTADTEAYEFQQIYGLEVMVLPTNKPCQRQDMGDVIYLTIPEKYVAIIDDIKDRHTKGQPILVGTISIENSEYLSKLLNEAHIPHEVLNAKHHEREATIIAQAGRPGAVTIATNMAGRGTDIVLGGNWKAEAEEHDHNEQELAALEAAWQVRHQAVIEAGGLHILGTERHESRRIDNQLRGRSGRQGDPGSSQFFLCLEDSLMRIFASDRMKQVMRKLGVEKGESITHPWVSRAIENAQRKVEGHNFDIRKQLLQFDNVANDQRQVIYNQRDELMKLEDVSDAVLDFLDTVSDAVVESHILPGSAEDVWNIAGLELAMKETFDVDLPIAELLEKDKSLDEAGLRQLLNEACHTRYKEKEKDIGSPILRHLEKSLILHQLDLHWKEHLAAMDYLRQSIHLRGYAQKDPKQEYKREAFHLFQHMLQAYQRAVISALMHVVIKSEEAEETLQQVDQQRRDDSMFSQMPIHQEVTLLGHGASNESDTDDAEQKVGRNQICPCGSGKKYKHCHGKIA